MMTIKKIFPVILLAGCCSLAACNNTEDKINDEFNSTFSPTNDDTKVKGPNSMDSLNLDEETAIKLAEAILVHIYGEKVLKQRPWIVANTDGNFKIEGVFNQGRKESFNKGGVAEITIRKSDGKVLEYSHGK